jgi:anti-sigma regulatory factor (Ser/Thr protein kinase)
MACATTLARRSIPLATAWPTALVVPADRLLVTADGYPISVGCTRDALATIVESDPGVLARARANVRAMLTGMGATSACTEAVCTVVSELVTNAQMHGSPPVELDVAADDGFVEVAVHDANPALPRVRDVTAGQGGYGLRIVAAMSDAWGTRVERGGKTVWCRVSVAVRPARDRTARATSGLTARA